MSELIKPKKENQFWDSNYIMHNKTKLSEVLERTVLYNNETGSNSTITLNDSVEKYEDIEIFYRNNDKYYNSIKINKPNNKQLSLMSVTRQSEWAYNLYSARKC